MTYCGHSENPLWSYIYMASSSSKKIGRNICIIFNRSWEPCDNTSYMPIWRSVPLACRESSIWDTSWMSRVCMWIQPRSKSSAIGWPRRQCLSSTASWALVSLLGQLVGVLSYRLGPKLGDQGWRKDQVCVGCVPTKIIRGFEISSLLSTNPYFSIPATTI
jgi:hypothetical protein